MTGASGAIYGIRLLETLRRLQPSLGIETHLVITPAAHRTIQQETVTTPGAVQALADAVYAPDNIGARIASGSFHTRGMIVIPCSIKSLSAIAHSYSDNLIGRAADVHLKEGRPLLLVVRETPLHLGHLRLMTQAAEIGATIMPPVPAFYARPHTLDDIVNHTVGRVLQRLGIGTDLVSEWPGTPPDSGE